jgi:ubiquinone/menaquinone biosynthesis C-methylase UbiE
MFSWLMAKYYDRMLQNAEKKCLHDWRKALLQDLSGEVLELGAGTGSNLAFYPHSLKRLVLTEPNVYMRQQLEAKLTHYTHLHAQVLTCAAESIPAPDQTFDAIVATFLLCTVKNPAIVLSEIHRVLRPNGKLIFIEHVAALQNPARLKWQHRFEPFWKILQCGCHLTRDTEKNILTAGFNMQKISRQSIRGVFPIVRPGIWGMAVKI